MRKTSHRLVSLAGLVPMPATHSVFGGFTYCNADNVSAASRNALGVNAGYLVRQVAAFFEFSAQLCRCDR
jgi:hypothetical protein